MFNIVTMKTANENDPKQVVVLDKALKLAEGWVNQMNGGQDSAQDAEEVEIQIRPPRLGLGAKFVPHSRFAATLNPVEKKLRAKLSAAKQQSDLDNEELISIRKDNNKTHKLMSSDVDDDHYDSDSRANAFVKKKGTSVANSLQSLVTSGKKRKRKHKESKL